MVETLTVNELPQKTKNILKYFFDINPRLCFSDDSIMTDPESKGFHGDKIIGKSGQRVVAKYQFSEDDIENKRKIKRYMREDNVISREEMYFSNNSRDIVELNYSFIRDQETSLPYLQELSSAFITVRYDFDGNIINESDLCLPRNYPVLDMIVKELNLVEYD